MKQDRKIRQHITAAKGWLSRAEDSLEQENAIQGDLKLMLAQAELKRAQEKMIKSYVCAGSKGWLLEHWLVHWLWGE